MRLYESITMNLLEQQSLLDKQKYIFNKYRDEFDSINEVYDLTDYINRLYSEGGMQKVDDEFFLPSASDEYKKDFKKLILKESEASTSIETLQGPIELSNIKEEYGITSGDYVSGLNIGDEVGLRWLDMRNSNDGKKIKDITPDYIELDIWDEPSDSLLEKQRFSTKDVQVVSDEVRFTSLANRKPGESGTLMFIRIKPIKERFIPTQTNTDNPHWDGNRYAL